MPDHGLDPKLYDCDRLYPRDLKNYYTAGTKWTDLSKETRRWLRISHVTVATVGTLSRIWMNYFNSVRIYHRERILNVLNDRSQDVALVTITNHDSCMDEPLLWGMLNYKELWNSRLMRWSLSAHDICFSNPFYSTFFSYGKSIPIVRGAGIYQQGMNFTLDRLNEGNWVHIFPEGRVNELKVDIRMKWGVARLLSECQKLPIVVPIYHMGMDSILPNRRPYIPHFGQKVTICVGEPIDLTETIKATKDCSVEEKRIAIMKVIAARMKSLKVETQIYHAKHTYKK